jgi:hypothetical protein
MSDEHLLPDGFGDLTPLLSGWALATERERYTRRLSMPLPELRLFYDTIQPRMDQIMRHLAGFPGGNPATLPSGSRRLYHLALSYFEASHPIELRWKASDLEGSFPATRIEYQAPSNIEN